VISPSVMSIDSDVAGSVDGMASRTERIITPPTVAIKVRTIVPNASATRVRKRSTAFIRDDML
jgi:hypothetical protein